MALSHIFYFLLNMKNSHVCVCVCIWEKGIQTEVRLTLLLYITHLEYMPLSDAH